MKRLNLEDSLFFILGKTGVLNLQRCKSDSIETCGAGCIYELTHKKIVYRKYAHDYHKRKDQKKQAKRDKRKVRKEDKREKKIKSQLQSIEGVCQYLQKALECIESNVFIRESQIVCSFPYPESMWDQKALPILMKMVLNDLEERITIKWREEQINKKIDWIITIKSFQAKENTETKWKKGKPKQKK